MSSPPPPSSSSPVVNQQEGVKWGDFVLDEQGQTYVVVAVDDAFVGLSLLEVIWADRSTLRVLDEQQEREKIALIERRHDVLQQVLSFMK